MKLLKPSALTIIVSMAGLTGAMMSVNAHATSKNQFLQSYSKVSNVKKKHIPIVYQAEKNATSGGKVVLRQARRMALEKRTIVKGSCWDYINTVFKKAGVKRKTIFKQTKNAGKYINKNKLQAGDWLYHINHSYNNVEHSGIFVGWVDKANNKALMLSYRGQNHTEPARYKVYNIRSTYNVMRPQRPSSLKSAAEQPINSQDQKLDFLALETLDDVALPVANPKLWASNGMPVQVVQGISLTEEQLTDPYYIETKPFHIPTAEAVRELQPKLIQMPNSRKRINGNTVKSVVNITAQKNVSEAKLKAKAKKEVMRKSIALENSVPTPDGSVKIETKATIIGMPVVYQPNITVAAPVIETKPVLKIEPVVEVSPVVKSVIEPVVKTSRLTKVKQAEQIMSGAIGFKAMPVAKSKSVLRTASKPVITKQAAIKKPVRKTTIKPAKKLVDVNKKDLKYFQTSYANSKNVKRQYLPLMYEAEQKATPAAQKVLGLGRVMSLDRREILQGTSRNYINAIFVRTGVDKEAVFKTNYPKGPFIASEKIASGDWVSFINHSYKNVEHNGVFVGWTDIAKKKALILSYPGEGSRKPARYRVYDLRHVYEVKRPVL